MFGKTNCFTVSATGRMATVRRPVSLRMRTVAFYGAARDGDPTWGTVFRIEPPQKRARWTFTVTYGFTGSPDGANPTASLVFDKQGNLYGTTENGGTGACYPAGCGTVFEVSP